MNLSRSAALLKLLKIKYPIIQGPMLGVSTPAMAAAVSDHGGLGSLAVGGLSPEKTLELIKETKQLTDKPFAVNLFAHDVPDQPDLTHFSAMQNFLKEFSLRNNIPYQQIQPADLKFYSYSDQIEILIKEKIQVVSFTFGVLNTESIHALKNAGITLIGTATCIAEAVLISKLGIDAVTAQGIEAGGHRGSFLTRDLPQIGSISLILSIVNAVAIPVLAAGGIADGKAFRAALELGAAGVQAGSIFIPAAESIACEAYKEAVLSAADTDTELTKAFSGRWARGIKNKFMEETKKAGLETPHYTVQNLLASQMRAYGVKHNQKDYISMWAGQSSSKAVRGTTAEILKRLIDDTFSPF